MTDISRKPSTNDADVSIEWTGPFCGEVLTSTVTGRETGQTFTGSGSTATFVLPNACDESTPVAYYLGGTANLDTGRTSSIPNGPSQGTPLSLPETECGQT